MRIVQFAQGVVEGRELEFSPDRFGKGISTGICNRKTLFDKPPQTPPTETSTPPINRHDPRRLFTDLLHFWIDELKRTAPCLPHLTEEIDFGFVSEAGVNPPVIEPYDLEISTTVIDETVNDHHSGSRYSAQSHALDAPTDEHPRARLEALIEAGDPGPVLVTTG
ncbi:MAG: hypothetical protein MUP13_16490 [Thermoanaerobaculales bacterium]|nr:hypothetical protein [Thermoanaerobaculales bacterium]